MIITYEQNIESWLDDLIEKKQDVEPVTIVHGELVKVMDQIDIIKRELCSVRSLHLEIELRNNLKYSRQKRDAIKSYIDKRVDA